MSASKLPEGLIQAFQETHYIVGVEPALTLRVGQPEPRLAALHDQHQVASSAFITAVNPYSAQLTPEQNAQRQAHLVRHLISLGFKFFEGIGQHPSNGWAGEPSFLILGVSLEMASSLGKQYEQNAIIWNGPDATPQLILLH